jgi:hypothetical protein
MGQGDGMTNVTKKVSFFKEGTEQYALPPQWDVDVPPIGACLAYSEDQPTDNTEFVGQEYEVVGVNISYRYVGVNRLHVAVAVICRAVPKLIGRWP